MTPAVTVAWAEEADRSLPLPSYRTAGAAGIYPLAQPSRTLLRVLSAADGVASEPTATIVRVTRGGRTEAVRLQDLYDNPALDIALRKEGELLGLRQSGLPPLRVARLADPRHRELSLAARRQAEALVGVTGRLVDGQERLEQELTRGWLARIGAGDVLEADELDA